MTDEAARSNGASPTGASLALFPARSAGAAREPGIVRGSGVGTSIAQHGELLQGQLDDPQRGPRRFLVSLPCDRLYSMATFTPVHEAGLTVEPAHKQKVREVVALTLARFGLDHVGGHVSVESNIEEGKGYGSSTADCVAAVRAVARALGLAPSEEQIAELVVAAELASDNFMFERAVLFAHREGVVLEDLGPCLPSLDVLGIDTDPRGVVYTLEHPPASYDWRQMQCFHTLVAGARRAVRHGDGALLGRIASASAAINQEFLPKPMFTELRVLAERARALGIAVAHSGTLLSLLFDPFDPELERRIEQTRRDLETLGILDVLRFRT